MEQMFLLALGHPTGDTPPCPPVREVVPGEDSCSPPGQSVSDVGTRSGWSRDGDGPWELGHTGKGTILYIYATGAPQGMSRCGFTKEPASPHCTGHGHPGPHTRTGMVPVTHLWFVRFPGIGCVQLSEDTLGFGKERLLFVNVVDPGLSAAEHQDHRTRLQTCGRDRGSC